MGGGKTVRIGLLSCLVVLISAFSAPAANASIAPIEAAAITASTIQAGSHADWQFEVGFEDPAPSTSPESILFERLPGSLNPWSVPQCSSVQFANAECMPGSQVGLVTLRGRFEGSDQLLGTAPVYVIATPDAFGVLGFWLPRFDIPVTSTLGFRADDNRLTWKFDSLPEEAAISGVDVELWGVPANPIHDDSRFPAGSHGSPAGCPGIAGTGCTSGTASGQPQTWFTLNSTRCSGMEPTYVKAWSTPQEEAASPAERHVTTPPVTGCSNLAFDPVSEVVPTTASANELSGLDLTVALPPELFPGGLSWAEMKGAAFELPTELELAEPPPGLVACGETEAGLFSETKNACPPASQVGTASVETSITPGLLEGGIYQGTPGPDGSDRLFFLTNGYGLRLKQVLSLKEDEETGVLTASFSQPELPIQHYELHLFGGDKALFVTPVYCGLFRVSAVVRSYADEELARLLESAFEVDEGPNGGPCLGPAKKVVVELQPKTVLADGHAQVTVHLEVLDENGAAIPRQPLEVTSTDSGQLLGPVVELDDGTYETSIQASTAPGTSTITATDLAVEPRIFGSAQLIQVGPSPPVPGEARPDPRVPVARFSKRPPHRTFNRKPRFSFRADLPGAGFECALDRKAFRVCSSPFSPPRLTLGGHRFSVRAFIPGGPAGPLTTYRFTVRDRPHRG